MATVATKSISAEEFSAFVERPENADRWFELEHGEIIELPPPRKPHGVVCANVTAILHSYSIANRHGYVTSNDSGYITERDPDSVRGPDVAYWDDAELATMTDPVYTETPPLVAVEVLSPDDRINRVLQKVAEYLASGAREVWVIDPVAQDVAVHRADRVTQFLSANDELDGGTVLSGFRCRVAEFFHPLPSNK